MSWPEKKKIFNAGTLNTQQLAEQYAFNEALSLMSDEVRARADIILLAQILHRAEFIYSGMGHGIFEALRHEEREKYIIQSQAISSYFTKGLQ